MKNLLGIFVFVLFAFGGIASCVNETRSEIKTPISQKLYWYSTFVCQDNIFLGIYKGELFLSRLEPGEKLKIFYGDSLVSDTIVASAGNAKFVLRTDKRYLLNIKLIYRGDTTEMVSNDSLYASSDDGTYHPFPLTFSVKSRDGAYLGFSLLKSDSAWRKLKCNGDIEKIVPDTLWVDHGELSINFTGDIYYNYYDIDFGYVDSSGVERNLFRYHQVYGGNRYLEKYKLSRGNFEIRTYTPVLPAELTLPFSFADYHIRIMKK